MKVSPFLYFGIGMLIAALGWDIYFLIKMGAIMWVKIASTLLVLAFGGGACFFAWKFNKARAAKK